jgi:putative two-component system response regulator
MMGKHRILIVDDVEQNRMLLGGMVQSLGYDVELARDGLEALAKILLDVDLVLLDVMMPGIDGFEVVRGIRSMAGSQDLPVIMVTALDSREDRVRSVEAGASDFIAKPVDKTELRVRIDSQLRLKDAQDQIRRHSSELELTVAARTQALRGALDEMVSAQRRTYEAHLDSIQRLVRAAGFRDENTAFHIGRMGAYAELLARSLHLPPKEVEILTHAAPLHDVGKIGIPDAILRKSGPLDADERRIMNTHTWIGAQILAGSPSEILQAGEVIALSHHEKWDGSGYPHGLAGDAIPVHGRICAIADVFDALTSDRPYRPAHSLDAALEMMRQGKGSHFDPELFRVFEALVDEIVLVHAGLKLGEKEKEKVR